MKLSKIIGSMAAILWTIGAGVGAYLGYRHGRTFTAVARELSCPRLPSDAEASEEATKRAIEEFRDKIHTDGDERFLAEISTATQKAIVESLPSVDKNTSNSNKEVVAAIRLSNAFYHTDDTYPRSLAEITRDITTGAVLGGPALLCAVVRAALGAACGTVSSVVNAAKKGELPPIIGTVEDIVGASTEGALRGYASVVKEGLFYRAAGIAASESKKPSETTTTTTPPQAEDKPFTPKPGLLR